MSVNSSKNKIMGGFKPLLKKAPHVLRMLQDIPRDLWDIFVPETEEDVIAMEMNLMNFEKKEQDREKVRSVQKQFNLPIRPNQDVEKLSVLVRIFLLKQEKRQYKDKGYHDLPDEPSVWG